jgi:hypothetical protein
METRTLADGKAIVSLHSLEGVSSNSRIRLPLTSLESILLGLLEQMKELYFVTGAGL